MHASMHQPPVRSSTTLDAPASERVLSDAVERRVPLQLSCPNGPGGPVWRGTFESETSEVLLLAPVDSSLELPTAWETAPLRATFCVLNQAYTFDARAQSRAPDQRAGTVSVGKPRRVKRIERRRAPRRRLQATSGVRLLPTMGANPIEGTLLNLSEHGLACRIDQGSAPGIQESERIRIACDLPSVAAPLELDARVIAVTPADDDYSVVGLEFVDNAMYRAQRELIGHVLADGLSDSADKESSKKTSPRA